MDIDTLATTAVDAAIGAIQPDIGTLKREIDHEVESAVQWENEETERVAKKIKVESMRDGMVVKQEEGRKKGVAPIKAEYVQPSPVVSPLTGRELNLC